MNHRDHFSAFSDDDKTVIRPAPGGRRPPRPVIPPGQSHAVALPDLEYPIDGFSGPHPLTALAFPLLSIVPKLRVLPFHQAAHDLQERLVAKVKSFEESASQQGA